MPAKSGLFAFAYKVGLVSGQVCVDMKISLARGSVIDVLQMLARFGGFPFSLPLLLDLGVDLPSVR